MLSSPSYHYILIHQNGTINSILDDIEQWSFYLGSPLIQTKINVKNINFNSINILPGEDGELYLINPKNTHFERLNITVPLIVEASPFTSSVLGDNKMFIGNKKISKRVINQNKMNVITTDYKLKLVNKMDNSILWDITIMDVSIEKEVKYSDIYNVTNKRDYDITIDCIKKGIKVYRMNKNYIVNMNNMIDESYKVNSSNNNKEDSNEVSFSIYRHTYKLCCACFIVFLLAIVRYFKNEKELTESHPTIVSKADDNIIKRSSFDTISQLSTKSVMSSDFGSNNTSLKKHKFYIYRHKLSAPDLKSEMELISPKESLDLFHRESEPLGKVNNDYYDINEQDELSPFKNYTCNRVINPHRNSDTYNQKLVKQKFKPSEEEKENLSNLEKSYKEYLHTLSNQYKTVLNSEIKENNELIETVKNNLLVAPGRFSSTFEDIEIIGKGTFGSVYKGMHKIDRCYYAIQVIKLYMGENEDISKTDVVKEIKTMMKVDYKKIIRYITCWFELDCYNPIDSKETNKSQNKKVPVYFYMQMEYCDGISLNYFLRNNKERLSKHLIVYLFSQITAAVQHIHGKNIIHRALKPENIIIHDEFKIKVGDFGLALDNPSESTMNNLYQSPEQLSGKEYDSKADIYGLGLILLEMCLHITDEEERNKRIENVKKMIYPNEDYFKTELIDEMKLIKKMTTIDPKKRLSIEEVVNSEEMSNMINNM